MVSREDVLRRGRGDLHQQGDADRDTGYSWGTGVIEDEGDKIGLMQTRPTSRDVTDCDTGLASARISGRNENN